MSWLVTGARVRASVLFMPKILALVALLAAAQLVTPQIAQAAPPDVTGTSPIRGPAAGGTSVNISGSNFQGATAVKFGDTDAASFQVTGEDENSLQAVTPAHAAGTVSVSVTTPDGTGVLNNAFTFVQTSINSINPNNDYAAGGSAVTLVGSGFTGATAVTFGGTAANFSVVSDTQIAATAPAHAVGKVDVIVTSPYGTSAAGAASKFTYLAAPVVTTIYKFKGGKDGGRPGPWMVADQAGNLYGVTDFQRSSSDTTTIFMLSPPKPPKTAWTHKVLHTFAPGARPFGSLSIDNSGVLYGATDRDGANKTGTVFRLRPGGLYEVLYEFPKSNKSPARSVVFGKDGVIFATTPPGISGGLGEIFSLAPSDTLPLTKTTLHTFKDDDAVGGQRLLIDKDGNLFANSYFFGASGRGAVFKFVPNGFAKGKFSLIYSFKATGNDGNNPIGGLAMDSDGVIYGATNGGGVGDRGMVFSLTPKSAAKFTEQKLTTFPGDFGGDNPDAGIALGKGGVLFGTTREGGTGRGNVFKLIPPAAGQTEWSYRTVYAFPGDANGQSPNSDLLIDKKGVIFGTTDSGGTPSCFCGTVFMIQE